MKDDRFHNPFLHFGLLGAIYATGTLTLFYHTLGHNIPLTASLFSQSCKMTGSMQTISVTKNGLEPSNVTSNRCDTLVFHNIDQVQHVIAFGSLARHVDYPDFPNKILQPGDTQRVTLRKSGRFQLHDYLSNIEGNLVIK